MVSNPKFDKKYANKLAFPYAKPDVTKKDIETVLKVFSSQFLAQGEKVKLFEKAIQNKFKVKNAVICNSGTSALHSVYKCLGLNSKNGIVTSPITFLATANAARMCDAPVEFADVDPINGLITPETLEAAIKKAKFKVKLAVVVHLGGHLCDMEGLFSVAKKFNCLLVEDACHAIGAKNYDKFQKPSFVGSCKYSIASTFSFHAIKNITMGEGGCVTTNSKELAEKVRLNISHGIIRDKNKMHNPPKNSPWYYQMNDIGWNYRASEISCALGLSQFSRLDNIILKRNKLALYYKKFIKTNKFIELPNYSEKAYAKGWHLFQLSVDFKGLGKSKKEFMIYLNKSSIGSQVHYIPIFLQPYYKKTNKSVKLNGAIKFYEKTISIPMYTSLKKNNIKYISDKINNFFS